MVDWRVLLAWAAVAGASVLLALSLMGDGTGPLGFAPMRGMVWSYILLGLGVAVALVIGTAPETHPEGGP